MFSRAIRLAANLVLGDPDTSLKIVPSWRLVTFESASVHVRAAAIYLTPSRLMSRMSSEGGGLKC